MTKGNKVKIYGVCLASDNSTFDFNGEIVTVEDLNSRRIYFYYKSKLFHANPKQAESIKLHYPNYVYINADGLDNLANQEEIVVNKTDIANAYARRGSHWIRYIVDPKSLMLSGVEDEKESEMQALEVGDIIISKDKLVTLLKKAGIKATEKEIDEALSEI